MIQSSDAFWGGGGAGIGALGLCFSLLAIRLKLKTASDIRAALRQLEADFYAIRQYGGAPASWFLHPHRQRAGHNLQRHLGKIRLPAARQAVQTALACHRRCWETAWTDDSPGTPDRRYSQVATAADGLVATQQAITLFR